MPTFLIGQKLSFLLKESCSFCPALPRIKIAGKAGQF
jgi:hypothetical protein